MKSMEKLAAKFNALLGITPGHFGSSYPGPPGAGTMRRRAREAAKNKMNAERGASRAPNDTRQLENQKARLAAKADRITPAEFGRRKMAPIHRGRKSTLLPKTLSPTQSVFKKRKMT